MLRKIFYSKNLEDLIYKYIKVTNHRLNNSPDLNYYYKYIFIIDNQLKKISICKCNLIKTYKQKKNLESL